MINLDNDEVVLLQADNILLQENNGIGKGFLSSGSHTGTLILTNKRLNFTYSTGILKMNSESIDIDLNQIKVFEGTAQLKPTNIKERVGYLSLIAYLSNNEYEFDFPQKEKRLLLEFANSVNKILTGVENYWTIEHIGGKDIAKTLRGAIGAATPVVSDLADAAKPLVPLAGGIMNAKSSTASGILGAVANAFVNNASNNDTATDQFDKSSALESQTGSQAELTLDEQINAVQKIKELYDAGILTEEEFQEKKTNYGTLKQKRLTLIESKPETFISRLMYVSGYPIKQLALRLAIDPAFKRINGSHIDSHY